MPVGVTASVTNGPADQTFQAIHQSCSGSQFRRVSSRRRRHKPPNSATHDKRHFSKIWRSSRQPIACRSLSKAQADTVPVQASHTRGKVVIIGAGPAGSTAAILLSKRGYSVEVYERRPQPKHDPIDLKRTYIIALSERGLKAMRAAGVCIPSDAPYKGFVRHLKGGKIQVSPAEGNVSLERAELAQHLISEAKRLAPSVKYHFQQGLHSVKFDRREATLQAEDGSKSQVKYDLLIGADGVGSTVRSEMEHQLPGMSVKIEDSGREYKTYRGLRADLEPDELKHRPGRSIHLFLGSNHWTSLSGHLNPDGSYAGTLAMKNGDFKKLKTTADYESVIRSSVNGVPEHWIPEVAKQCVDSSPSPQGRRVWCSKLTGPGVLLLGDAAHAVTPVGGQGANAALEDCLFLDGVLEATGDNLAKAVPTFDRERLPDAHGLVDIESSFSKLVGNKFEAVLDLKFLKIVMHVVFGSAVHKLLPFIRNEKPAMVRLGSDLRYSEIMQEVNRDAATVAVLLLTTIVIVCLKAARIW
ncbi:TPA: hypothetical protein ACH3X2_010809 [Trebouxia sp. C0005]